ncbi:UNVERIFIED_CONTAM: Transcription factor [Sesamum calycinum]|uniref:Transcription factor n=1 Tax=Sesamum calycinum TaxID=2727403 RepID=A0AAW2MZC8_9LAMI
MVCQAASQTRFRALKHENGIAGCATIIVRVIACFQPLQDCQLLVLSGNCCASMEKDCGFGIHQHSMPPLSPNMNSLVSGLQQLKASQRNDSENWLYGMPHFHPAFAPALNSAFQEKFPAGRFEFGREKSPTIGIAPVQKRFLVFDQSGDKTTLVYSSGVQTPVQHGARWVPSPLTTYNSNKEELRNSIYPLRSSVKDENIEDNSRDVTEDEMHEDTEELDALLCSDNDSDFSENDEETSTGHSPSTMTDNGIQDLVEETGEEVDSFLGPTKRQKLLDGGYNAPSKRKTSAHYAFEDDAESSCGNGNKQLKEELGSSSGCKRSRKEKIRETISILQSIIPSGNGKDAIVVIDEAIHYLRSLKVKAKALGLDSL